MLGLATRAVHLVGTTPQGQVWVQLRAHTKPNNPGQWDTLMGGMVSAADSLQTALERETWEEAGLSLEHLQDLVHGGQVHLRRPSREGAGTGYMVETIDWFRAVVPAHLSPVNQDGEVERFEALELAPLGDRLAQGAFTLEASLVLAQYLQCR